MVYKLVASVQSALSAGAERAEVRILQQAKNFSSPQCQYTWWTPLVENTNFSH
jgi:hypothetical protein